MSFADHFSGHADRYAAYRPSYPDALFDFLAGLAPANDRAWDCATGNGQAAIGLAAHFRSVVATDASFRQIAGARPHPAVRYVAATAERPPLPDGAADLVAVAQALHWFRLDRFYDQARRVLRPGGVIAAWCYTRTNVDPAIDGVVDHYYEEVVGPDWPAERSLVEAGYRTIPFPFAEVAAPPLAMSCRWDLPRLIGYLDTWSASQRYRARTGRDPIDGVRDALVAAWGEPAAEREVRWPLAMRVGRA